MSYFAFLRIFYLFIILKSVKYTFYFNSSKIHTAIHRFETELKHAASLHAASLKMCVSVCVWGRDFLHRIEELLIWTQWKCIAIEYFFKFVILLMCLHSQIDNI